MHRLNVEIKARCARPDRVRDALAARGAALHGVDHQVDTYFRCPAGRLKLREGNIEHSLVHYDRPDRAGPKPARITLCQPRPDPALKQILSEALGVLVVVAKQREIWFLGNVKFHVDRVERLGRFVEIEAIDADGTMGPERLRAQCEQYMAAFGIAQDDLVACSYSDLLLAQGG